MLWPFLLGIAPIARLLWTYTTTTAQRLNPRARQIGNSPRKSALYPFAQGADRKIRIFRVGIFKNSGQQNSGQ